MWEFCLEIEKEYNHYLNYIIKNLQFENFKVYSQINENILSVGCEKQHKIKVINKLKNLIAEIAVLIYKEKYFLENLKLDNLSADYKSALIKCLVLFDYEDDLYFVFDNLELNYNLNLQSFYLFKLKPLTFKWQDISNIAKNNGNYIENETIIELIKFLIDSITPKREAVNIYFNGNTFVLSDETNTVIKLNEDSSDARKEINLITTLITLSPKQINLHCISSLTENTFKIIYYIFNKKVNLLV